MTSQTILFDLPLKKNGLQIQNIAKVLRHELEHIFPQMEMAYQMPLDDGYFAVLFKNKETFITLRIYPQGLVTINKEYCLENGKE